MHNEGNERINALGGNDEVFAGVGNDMLYGNAGNDKLHGQEGHDDLYGGDGKDLLNGGDGSDMLYGGKGNDSLYGGANNENLTADPPVVVDSRYADTLEGGEGTDVMHGGNGKDFLVADFADLAGSNAISSLTFPAAGQAVPNTITGGPGVDTISFEDEEAYPAGSTPTPVDTTGGVQIQLYGTNNAIEHFIGSERADVVTQAAQHSTAGTVAIPLRLDQYGGSDVHLEGGNDRFTGGENTIDHDGLASTVAVGRNDTVYGGEGKDTLNGSDGNDMLYGENHDDELSGGGGSDKLSGGGGNDKLHGDTATTDDGVADVLTGGAGSDAFSWGDKDTITDFNVKEDSQIDLSAAGPLENAVGGISLANIQLDSHVQGGVSGVRATLLTGDTGETMFFAGLSLPTTDAAQEVLLDELFML